MVSKLWLSQCSNDDNKPFEDNQTLDINDDNNSEDDSEDGWTGEDWIQEIKKQNPSKQDFFKFPQSIAPLALFDGINQDINEDQINFEKDDESNPDPEDGMDSLLT